VRYRRLALALLLTIVIPLLACGSSSPSRVEVRAGGLVVHAELARTPQERVAGLGNRDSLAKDAGMLFVFPSAQQPTFWMKDMRFPLDFVWISAEKRVVQVTENVPPPASGTPDSALQIYAPAGPVQFVLEVNAGAVARGGVQVGDIVSFQPEVSFDGVR
jgi:uncharacterized protein